jgi:hypothetical protein
MLHETSRFAWTQPPASLRLRGRDYRHFPGPNMPQCPPVP